MCEVFEREFYEFSVEGRSFRIEEFTGRERRRYTRKILELHERSKATALEELETCGEGQIDLTKLSDAIMEGEEEFAAWLLSLASPEEVTSEWVANHFPVSMQTRLLAKVDEINKMGEHVGNVFNRLGIAQAALMQTRNGSSSSTR